jgi:hypothetical protein
MLEQGRRGGRWRNHRQVMNGLMWRLCTGAQWRDRPERYGPWQTVYDRFVRWRREGLFARLLRPAARLFDHAWPAPRGSRFRAADALRAPARTQATPAHPAQGLHESGQELHDGFAWRQIPPSCLASGLLVSAHARAVEEHHSDLGPALLHKGEQALPYPT